MMSDQELWEAQLKNAMERVDAGEIERLVRQFADWTDDDCDCRSYSREFRMIADAIAALGNQIGAMVT